jgi:hypothetical protein
MEADKLDLKPELVAKLYSDIDLRARQISGGQYEQELRISRDAKDVFRFYVSVSERMAPSLISAVQQSIEKCSGIGLRSHFYKLQELIMAELFAGAKDVIQIG